MDKWSCDPSGMLFSPSAKRSPSEFELVEEFQESGNWKILEVSFICLFLSAAANLLFCIIFLGGGIGGGGGGIKGILNGTSWLVGLNFKAEK